MDSTDQKSVVSPGDITLARDTIHNPREPRHFMKVKPASRRVRALRDGVVLADSGDARRVLELGRDFYDPVFYFPTADVRASLVKAARTSHCPIKGDAIYFDLVDSTGAVLQPEIAWSYPEPFDFTTGLTGLIAFYADQVTLEESPQ